MVESKEVNGVGVMKCPSSGIRYVGACPYCHLMAVANGAVMQALRLVQENGYASMRTWDEDELLKNLGGFDEASPFRVERDEATGAFKLVDS